MLWSGQLLRLAELQHHLEEREGPGFTCSSLLLHEEYDQLYHGCWKLVEQSNDCESNSINALQILAKPFPHTLTYCGAGLLGP